MAQETRDAAGVRYTLFRSRRRTLALEIRPDGEIRVRAPLRAPQRTIDAFVASRRDWIDEHAARAARRRGFEAAHFGTEAQCAALRAEAKRTLPALTAVWAARMGVEPTGVRITGARTRFGSCSAKNAVSYSFRLMAYPPEAIEYVVVHELAHIRHKDHSRAFYAAVEAVLPDYRRRAAMLRFR